MVLYFFFFFFFQAEDGIRDGHVTGVQTCALPIYGILPVARAVAGRCVYGLRGRSLRGRSGIAIFVWVRGAGFGRRMALPLPLGARSRRGKESIRVACG